MPQCLKNMNDFDELVDASGLSCPLPLLKAKQALNTLNSGQVLKVIATDAGSLRDFNAFTDIAGHQMLSADEIDGQYFYRIRKK